MGGKCIECGRKSGASERCSSCAARQERITIAAWLRTLPAMQHPQALADAVCACEHHKERTARSEVAVTPRACTCLMWERVACGDDLSKPCQVCSSA